MERITVVESLQGKFGPQIKDANGYLSYGKFFKGNTSFAPGTELEVDLFTTAKGNRYINSLTVVSAGAAIAPSNQGVNTAPVDAVKRGRKPGVKSGGSASEEINNLPVSKKEVNWDELGRGKTASLFVAALLQNPNVVQSLDVDVDGMDKLVWDLVDLVFKTRKTTV